MGISEVDALFAAWNRPDRPGIAVGVLQGGEIVHRRGYGMASLEHRIHNTPETRFRIGSISKHFAVYVALLLDAEGRLRIDDRAGAYDPDLNAPLADVTLRQLMNNTAGAHDFLELLTLSGAGVARPVSSAESAALIRRQPQLNCRPGDRMIYSAGGFLLLSNILERITGEKMESLLQARLFGPLDMTSGHLMRRDDEVLADMATPYVQRADGRFTRGGWGLEVNCEGGIVANLDDMLRWGSNLLSPRVGNPEIVACMTEPTRYTGGALGIYGLGLCTGRYRGVPWFGHGGRYPGFRAELACYPEDELAIVLLTNVDTIVPFEVGRQIADICIGERLAPEPAADLVPGGEVLAGWYYDDGGELLQLVTAEAGLAVATNSGRFPLRLQPAGWLVPQNPVWDFRLRLDAGTGDMHALDCGREVIYRPVPEPPAIPDGTAIAGHYCHEALDTAYLVTAVADGTLILEMRGALGRNTARLEPILPDVFRAVSVRPDWGPAAPTVRVSRGSDGAVAGLIVSSDRAKNLIFSKRPGGAA